MLQSTVVLHSVLRSEAQQDKIPSIFCVFNFFSFSPVSLSLSHPCLSTNLSLSLSRSCLSFYLPLSHPCRLPLFLPLMSPFLSLSHPCLSFSHSVVLFLPLSSTLISLPIFLSPTDVSFLYPSLSLSLKKEHIKLYFINIEKKICSSISILIN